MDYAPFETSRLRFEPLSEEHLEGYHEIWSDERCARWSLRGATKSLEDSRARLLGVTPSPSNPNVVNYAIRLRSSVDSSEPTIAVFGCYKVSPPEAELGYLFNANHWGKGYASEAIIAFIPKFFELQPDVDVIHAIVDSDNGGSVRVLEKAGFKATDQIVEPAIFPLIGPEPRGGSTLFAKYRLS
ncbi:GNAT domain-containing protein [Flagelloscypha sp. PMI_526]|nr:GNAT domain-containing protein [Flagelloscypha sp. PMI_526]